MGVVLAVRALRVVPRPVPDVSRAGHGDGFAARRIHLRAQRAIRRALVEAQPAVHAPRVQVPCRLLVRREVGMAWLDPSRRGTQTRDLPLRTLFGSSACFTACMLVKLAGAIGHGLAACSSLPLTPGPMLFFSSSTTTPGGHGT